MEINSLLISICTLTCTYAPLIRLKSHGHPCYRLDRFGQLERLKLPGVQRRSQTPEGPAEPALAVPGLHQGHGIRDEEAPGNDSA